ncbi:hypothetical protein [Nocardia cyriacigeorgica]|uniref:Uncharacterized protein n=1 Tax=Nocardia cyriacigeorgica TaxID=135487 RepID=A0A4U8VVH7_9NOCA|nr:hypothetical protein [Nocardia cyriacigeorgica]VFA96329.1 Uncharacterised protein [Nocardia cyriacigeorgica]
MNTDDRMTPFERAQHAAVYREWLAAMDTELARFLAEDAPEIGALDDPYTPEGLRMVEQNVERVFGDRTTLYSADTLETRERYARFIGEVFRRATEGKWVNVAHLDRKHEGGESWAVLLFPWTDIFFDPRDYVGTAFVTMPREPSEIVWVYNNMVGDYTEWVGVGRPTPEEYDRIVIDRLVSEADGSDV